MALNPLRFLWCICYLKAHVWTWDARPFPAFPDRSDVWSDGGNWRLGHWLNGRLGDAPADALIAAILRDHGLMAEEFDVTGVDAGVTGYLVGGPTTARQALEDLMRLTGTIAKVSGVRLVFRSMARLRASAVIEAFVDAEGPYVELRRGEAGERPQEIALSYLDPSRAYQPATAEAVKASAENPRKEIVSLPVVLVEGHARELSRSLLREVGAVTQTASFSVANAMLAVEVGDVVELQNRPGAFLVTRIEAGEAQQLEARLLPDKRRSFADQGEPAAGPLAPGPVAASRPVVMLLDLPLPEGGSGFDGARFAVSAQPFPGYAIDVSRQGSAFSRQAVATRAATSGVLDSALGPGPEGRLDLANRLVVKLDRGALASISMPALLEGGNLCAVECADGGFEVLQFATAAETASNVFSLTGLLRAQGGTEDAMAAGSPAGAGFVLLDAACGALGLTAANAARTATYRISPLGRPLDDPATVTLDATLGGRSVRPLSPVHLRARFESGGSVTIDWVRRTRIGGDSWDGIDVPLGEERERYRVEIADGSGASRLSYDVDSATLAVAAEAQIAAFGELPEMLTVGVSQVSPVWGPGTTRTRHFNRPAAST